VSAADAFRLSPLHTDDTAALAALHRQVMGEADGWSDAGLRRLLTATAARGFQATADGALAGYILAFAAADEAEILALVVSPGHRRMGLARRLLRALARQLADSQIVRLHLEVRASNLAARELYSRNSFAETGRRKGYYAGAATLPPEDAVTMTLDLRSLTDR